MVRYQAGLELPMVERGDGVYLWDTAGTRYLDGSSGAVVANIGHGRKEVAEAIARQVEKVAYVHRGAFTSEAGERLAARIASLAPASINHVYFASGGSEAVEAAIKFAIQYWSEVGRPTKCLVVSRWNSYHGGTLGALSATGHRVRRRNWERVLLPFPQVAPANPYRCACAADCPPCTLACADEFAAAIEAAGPENVAAVIAEPVVGAAGGAVVAPPGYFQRVRRICDQYDVLLIADEVMSGVGRCGGFLALEHWGVTADLVPMGKGLASGYAPLSATLIGDRVYRAIAEGSGNFSVGHTHSSNPMSMAAGLAVLDIMDREGLWEIAGPRGAHLLQGLQELAAEHPLVGEARGLGLLCGLELVSDRGTRTPFPAENEITARLVRNVARRGLLIYPANTDVNDAVLVAPPLVVQPDQVDQLLETLDAALADTESELDLD